VIRHPKIFWVLLWALFSAAAAGACVFTLYPRHSALDVQNFPQCFRLDPDGRWSLTGDIGREGVQYISARFVVRKSEQQRFLGFPLVARVAGEWSWIKGDSGLVPLATPPSEREFAPAAATLDDFYSTRTPWFHHTELAFARGPFDRTYWFAPGVIALAVASAGIAGPLLTLLVFAVVRQRRINNRARSRRLGQCESCSYPLVATSALNTGSPIVCPECGRAHN